jgi:hypothetical protein
MGMGFAMANQMGQSFTQQPQQQAPQQQAPQTPPPPPIPPALTFHAVINGQQAGPYDMNTLQQLVSQSQVTKETLVWRQGMANWIAIAQVPELNNLFGAVPPPLPPQ